MYTSKAVNGVYDLTRLNFEYEERNVDGVPEHVLLQYESCDTFLMFCHR
jgi:hypothetical protein